MNAHLKNLLVSAIAGVIPVLLSGCSPGYESDASAETYSAQLAREDSARKSDPAWKVQTRETAMVRVGKGARSESLTSFCLHTNGNLLACWLPQARTPSLTSGSKGEIRVLTPRGELVDTWKLPLEPEAICCGPDGTVYTGGKGRLAKLDGSGKVLLEGTLPGGSRSDRQAVTGIALAGDDLFVAAPSPGDYTYTVYRLNTEFKESTPIIKGLRGCCGQMDIQAREGKVWVAHNAKHRVEAYDRTGKLISGFGKYDRTAADGFGGCCEPKNLRLAADGNIYASESGPPVTIKRFSPEGKFLGVAALPKFSSGCVRVSIEVSPDAKTFYILDTAENAIRVLTNPE